MKLFKLISGIVLFGVMMTSCNNFKKQIVGTWKSVSESTTAYQFTFHEDDRMDVKMVLEEQRESVDGKDFRIHYNITATGTYEANPKEITYTLDPKTIGVEVGEILLKGSDLSEADQQKAIANQREVIKADSTSFADFKQNVVETLSHPNAKLKDLYIKGNTLEVSIGSERCKLERETK